MNQDRRNTNARRETALKRIIRQEGIYNEDGDRREDFAQQNRDALDFSNIHIAQLERMLQLAFEAGRDDAKRQA